MIRKILKIAVFGLSSEALTAKNKTDAYEIGKKIAESGCMLITGLAKGITEFATKGAKSSNGIVIGINPYQNASDNKLNVSYTNTDLIINTGFQDRGRNVISVRTCDAMIVINGNFGVLNEITIGVGEDKPIIVIKNSGGVAEIIENIFLHLKPDYKKFKMVDTVDEVMPTVLRLIDCED